MALQYSMKLLDDIYIPGEKKAQSETLGDCVKILIFAS
jgi:hypothetical protein